MTIFPRKLASIVLRVVGVRIFTEISEECCGLYQVIMCFHHIETCPTLIRLVSYLHRRNWNQRSHTHTTQVSGLSLQIDKFGPKKSCIGSPDLDSTTYIHSVTYVYDMTTYDFDEGRLIGVIIERDLKFC